MNPAARKHSPPAPGLAALLVAAACPSLGAQAVPAPDSVASAASAASAPAERVVVVGHRASLDSAQALKRERLAISDSVVADDIIRLPDFSVGEALQRITGVQIQRDRGESGPVTVRGLTQVETTLNGREVFTAGTGRALDFADFPAELVAGIDVYKTATADQLEGGIGGTVDLRTRRPFDFPGSQLAASARLVHGDLRGREAPQFAALASQRWALPGAGEFGALLSVSLQRRAWREDQKGSGAPLVRNDIAPGATVSGGTSETSSAGTRRRAGASAVLQWRPTPAAELYAEAAWQEFLTRQDSHQINASASPAFDPASVVFFPGSTEVSRITWLNAPLSILSFARDTIDRNHQAALGGKWQGESLLLKADISHARSYNHLFFSGPFFAGTAAAFTHDVYGRVPDSRVDGTDLDDPANFRYTGLAYRTRPFRGELTAARIDGEWALDGPVQAVQAGLRTARRRAHNAPGLVFGDVALSGIGAADRPAFIAPHPFGDFFHGTGSDNLNSYMTGDLGLARDPLALREAFGITTPPPAGAGPLTLWQINETTHAGWLQAPFVVASGRLEGLVGLRAVQTHEAVEGYQSVPSDGSIVPISIDSRYTDWLPSASLRWRPAAGWAWRAAASRTVTRPDFNLLSPSLTLVPNPVDPRLNQGLAGNPALRPVRSDNLDLAVEHEAGRAGAVALTGFVKWVDGFVANASAPEMHDGQLYQVSRPYNSLPARVQGLELGGHVFFVDLPGAWRGLGVQASYTYIDSETTNIALGTRMPLQGLSRNSANLVALYELGPLSARLAWNWRDRFLSGTRAIAGVGTLPVWTDGYGWLDASLRWRVNPQLTLALDGGNLTRTVRRSYFGSQTRPDAALLNDRQYSVSASLAF